ncbi:MAG TPA: STAS domain-containing protein [Planctomycetota bacterium]|nr:STAS domain-containing protein [Planctomycetota bacterium]
MTTSTIRVRRLSSLPRAGTIAVDGPIDLRTLGGLQKAVAAARKQGARTILLDLSKVRYINSTGMAYLVTLSDALAETGGRLNLAEPQPKLKVVLDLMGLTAVLKTWPTLESAIRALGAARGARRKVGKPA